MPFKPSTFIKIINLAHDSRGRHYFIFSEARAISSLITAVAKQS